MFWGARIENNIMITAGKIKARRGRILPPFFGGDPADNLEGKGGRGTLGKSRLQRMMLIP